MEKNNFYGRTMVVAVVCLVIVRNVSPAPAHSTSPHNYSEDRGGGGRSDDIDQYVENFLGTLYDRLVLEEVAKKRKQPVVDIYDQMQGDQPTNEENNNLNPEDLSRFFASSQNASEGRNMSDAEYLRTLRNRTKDNWIQALKQNILSQIGRTNMTKLEDGSLVRDGTATGYNLSAIVPSFLNATSATTTFFNDDQVTEKIRSYSPMCELPPNTEQEQTPSKKDENIMHLYFDFDTEESTVTTVKQLNIAAATLRLYRLPGDNSTLTKLGGGGGCDTGANSSASEEERLLRVSIYWYSKSLRKKRVKRRLSDSKVISETSRWVDLNVKPATKAWSKQGRNLGLAVLVEDQEGNTLKAERCFKGASCTVGASTPKPIPTIIIDAARKSNHLDRGDGVHGGDAAASLLGDAPLPPTIDICTVELPENFQPGVDPPAYLLNTCDNLRRSSSPKGLELEGVSNGFLPSSSSTSPRHIRHQRQHLADFDPRSRIINKRILTNEELQHFKLNLTSFNR